MATETCNLCPWHAETQLIAFEGTFFSLFFPKVPMVYREDGGHLIMIPKRHVVDIADFTDSETQEYMVLAKAASKVMYSLLPELGIDVGRINYHDNGNLEADKKIGAHQHLHFYGRARSAKFQKWKSNLSFPDFDPQQEYYKNATHFTDAEKHKIREFLKTTIAAVH